MIDFFKKFKIRKYKSIYDRILDLESKKLLDENSLIDFYSDKEYKAGTFEYDYLRNKDIVKNKKTFDLNNGIKLSMKRDPTSIIVMTEYFEKNRALESIHGFESYLLSQDIFDEQRLLGLSILLMRDTNSIEAVKFGILLTRYYQLKNAPAAVEIIKNLSIHPEFTYYGLEVLKVLDNYEKLYNEIVSNTFSYGKKIGELIK